MPATPQVLQVLSLNEVYIGFDQPLDNNSNTTHFHTSIHLVGRFPWENSGDGWSYWQHGAPDNPLAPGYQPNPPYEWHHSTALYYRCNPLHEIGSDPIYQGLNVSTARDIYSLGAGDYWIEETWSSPNSPDTFNYTTVLTNTPPIDLIKNFLAFTVYSTAPGSGRTVGNWVSDITFVEEPVNFESHTLTDPGGQYVTLGGSSAEVVVPGGVSNGRGLVGYCTYVPTVEAHVSFHPVDANGQPITGKRVWVCFGDLYDAFNFTGSTDLSRYIKDTSVPVDTTYTIPGKTNFVQMSIGTPSDGANYQLYVREDEVKSEGTRCTIAWQYPSVGLASASNAWLECANPEGPVIQHLSSEDCGAVDQVVATVTLPATKALSPSWAVQSGSGSVAGGQLTSTGSNTVFRATYTTPLPDLRPYRFFAFEYAVQGGGSVDAVVRLKQRLGSVREYPVTLSNTGTAWIDVMYPSIVNGTDATTLSKLSTFNQANANTSGGGSTDRWCGLAQIDYIEVKFSNAVVTLTDVGCRVRWSAELACLNLDNGLDDTDENTRAMFAGHVDGRDAFRITAEGTIQADVNRLVSQQGLTLDSTSYATTSGQPFASFATRLDAPVPLWSLQDLSGALHAPEDVVAGASIRCSPKTHNLGGNRFFYGLKALGARGWWNTVRANCVWGNGFSATAVPFCRTKMEVNSPSNPAFDHVYRTSRDNGYGLLGVTDTRHAYSLFTSNVTHWCPGHPTPQTKQTVRLGNSSGGVAVNGHRYHVTILGVPEGTDGAVSYDVAPHMRHFVGYLQENRAWLRRAPNANHQAVDEVDTGIDCTSLCVRVERDGLQRLGMLYVSSPDKDVKVSYSGDDGESWTVPTTIGSNGLAAAMVYSPTGSRYYYWLEDQGGGSAHIKGQIRDALDSIVEPTFTVLTGVSTAGIAADESIASDGLHRVTLLYVDSNQTLTSIVSNNGKDFS